MEDVRTRIQTYDPTSYTNPPRLFWCNTHTVATLTPNTIPHQPTHLPFRFFLIKFLRTQIRARSTCTLQKVYIWNRFTELFRATGRKKKKSKWKLNKLEISLSRPLSPLLFLLYHSASFRAFTQTEAHFKMRKCQTTKLNFPRDFVEIRWKRNCVYLFIVVMAMANTWCATFLARLIHSNENYSFWYILYTTLMQLRYRNRHATPRHFTYSLALAQRHSDKKKEFDSTENSFNQQLIDNLFNFSI